MEDRIEDVMRIQIAKGDIVIRAKFSSFVFHRVIGFTKKSIKLSVYKKRYYIRDSYSEVDLLEHNDILYFSKYGARTSLKIVK